MGCDIHPYIEYEVKRNDGATFFSDFGSRISLGRNYTLFSLMAGVRYSREGGDFKPLFEPKGMPSGELSWPVKSDYTLIVDDRYKDSDGFCSKEQAERWVANGSSQKLDGNRITGPDWHSASWLTAAELERVQDAYANIRCARSSWYQDSGRGLSAEQLEDGARIVEKNVNPYTAGAGGFDYVEVGERTALGPHPMLAAVIAAMKALDAAGHSSRLVFWFDN